MPIINRSTLVGIVSFSCLLGCNQPKENVRDVPLGEGRVARRVAVTDVVGGKMQVEYRTSHNVRECGVQAEVRELWLSFVKAEAERLGAVSVLIWPQEESHASRSFEYSRTTNREHKWDEVMGFLPCQ